MLLESHVSHVTSISTGQVHLNLFFLFGLINMGIFFLKKKHITCGAHDQPPSTPPHPTPAITKTGPPDIPRWRELASHSDLALRSGLPAAKTLIRSSPLPESETLVHSLLFWNLYLVFFQKESYIFEERGHGRIPGRASDSASISHISGGMSRASLLDLHASPLRATSHQHVGFAWLLRDFYYESLQQGNPRSRSGNFEEGLVAQASHQDSCRCCCFVHFRSHFWWSRPVASALHPCRKPQVPPLSLLYSTASFLVKLERRGFVLTISRVCLAIQFDKGKSIISLSCQVGLFQRAGNILPF